MTEIFYINNKKQYKQVMLRLCKEFEAQDHMWKFNVCGCDYADNECVCCEEEICLALEHFEDKNVLNNISVYDPEGIPCIVVMAETYDASEKFTVIPVSEARLNTKYGVNGYY